ncbi:MAG: hypothetical protein RR620_12480 [Clostridium sp.]
MTITQEFRDAVNSKDSRLVRIMLKDSLVVDPTFIEFNEMIKIAETKITDLYDEHDGEVLKYEISTWSKDYMDEQMVQVVYNFSIERVNLLKSICKHLYRDRASKIENDRYSSEPRIIITQKQAGTGLAVVGVGAIAIGLAIEAPIIATVGVVAGVAGAAMIITDK